MKTFISPVDGWKIPFYVGSAVALFGTIARRALKETPEFVRTIDKMTARKKIGDFYLILNHYKLDRNVLCNV